MGSNRSLKQEIPKSYFFTKRRVISIFCYLFVFFQQTQTQSIRSNEIGQFTKINVVMFGPSRTVFRFPFYPSDVKALFPYRKQQL